MLIQGLYHPCICFFSTEGTALKFTQGWTGRKDIYISQGKQAFIWTSILLCIWPPPPPSAHVLCWETPYVRYACNAASFSAILVRNTVNVTKWPFCFRERWFLGCVLREDNLNCHVVAMEGSSPLCTNQFKNLQHTSSPYHPDKPPGIWMFEAWLVQILALPGSKRHSRALPWTECSK